MSSAIEYNWYKIAESIADIPFSTNGLAEIEINGKKICVALHNNTLFACSQKCPHAGGKLTDGYIDGTGNLVCPLHRYKFNMQNGRNVSGEGYYLKTFPLQEQADGIYIGL